MDRDEGLPALCYNLLDDPAAADENPEYAGRLRDVLGKLDLPLEYIQSVTSGGRR